MGLLSECLSILRTQLIMFMIGWILANITWVADECETLDEVVNLDHREARIICNHFEISRIILKSSGDTYHSITLGSKVTRKLLETVVGSRQGS